MSADGDLIGGASCAPPSGKVGVARVGAPAGDDGSLSNLQNRLTAEHAALASATAPAPRHRHSGITRAGHGPGHPSSDGRAGSPRAAREASGTEVGQSEQRLVDLRRENEALLLKLARVSQVIQALVADLAMSRRELRRKQQELDSLRAHAGSPGSVRSGSEDASASDLERVESEVRRFNARNRARQEPGGSRTADSGHVPPVA